MKRYECIVIRLEVPKLGNNIFSPSLTIHTVFQLLMLYIHRTENNYEVSKLEEIAKRNAYCFWYSPHAQNTVAKDLINIHPYQYQLVNDLKRREFTEFSMTLAWLYNIHFTTSSSKMFEDP